MKKYFNKKCYLRKPLNKIDYLIFFVFGIIIYIIVDNDPFIYSYDLTFKWNDLDGGYYSFSDSEFVIPEFSNIFFCISSKELKTISSEEMINSSNIILTDIITRKQYYPMQKWSNNQYERISLCYEFKGIQNKGKHIVPPGTYLITFYQENIKQSEEIPPDKITIHVTRECKSKAISGNLKKLVSTVKRMWSE